jgi:lysophospholipase L1-like esterase
VRLDPPQPSLAASRVSRRKVTTLSAVLLAMAGLGPAASAATSGPAASSSGQRWVAAWAASPVIGSVIPFEDCPAGAGLTDATVRNVVFVSAGGSSVRVRLTNAFGAHSMLVGHASVAVQGANAEPVAGTVRGLTFGGSPQVRVAAGGEALSDPVGLRVAALSTLLVSVYVPGPTGPITNHPFTAQGNFLGSGDQVLATTGAGFANTPCWMLVDGVDIRASGGVVGSVVALGDSITDTANTTGNANRRWPDDLARRLAARRGATLSVVNAGLGGNRVLEPRDGEPFYGVPALARLDRDVFAQTGVRTVILLEGVNDIGFNASAAEIIAGYQQVIALTHARGLRILGGTITPFGGSFLGDPGRTATRNAVNTWVRTSHAFDGVIDFARATASPTDAEALDPRFDSGDHLHPNDAGCQAMADAVNLAALFG